MACWLARHATHDLIGRVLAGRMQGVALNAAGHAQAERIARRIARHPVALVQTSPRQRALETARAIARWTGAPVETSAALDEIEFGDWTARTFEELGHDARWSRWNSHRGLTQPPGGESMAHVQDRIVAHLGAVGAHFRGRCVVLVTHAEVVRAALLHARELPLHDWQRIEILPGSVWRWRPPDRGHAAGGALARAASP